MKLIKGQFKFSDIVKAYEQSLCNVSITCKKLGIRREHFYYLINKNPKFKERIQRAREVQIDYVENAFMKLVEEGNPQAIIHYMKTVGKDRGFNENTNINLSIQKYQPNNLTFEERMQLVDATVNALTERETHLLIEAQETVFTEVS